MDGTFTTIKCHFGGFLNPTPHFIPHLFYLRLMFLRSVRSPLHLKHLKPFGTLATIKPHLAPSLLHHMKLEHPLIGMVIRKCVFLNIAKKDIVFCWVPAILALRAMKRQIRRFFGIKSVCRNVETKGKVFWK